MLAAPPAEAAIVRGIAKMFAGLFAIPAGLLSGTATGPPLVGTVFGAISGTMTGAGLLLSGAWDLVTSGVAVAKMAAPFVLPFIF